VEKQMYKKKSELGLLLGISFIFCGGLFLSAPTKYIVLNSDPPHIALLYPPINELYGLPLLVIGIIISMVSLVSLSFLESRK